MKRIQPSGSENRRKKKIKQEEAKKQEGAFMKYLVPNVMSTATTTTSLDVASVDEIETTSSATVDRIEEETVDKTENNLSDIGTWPSIITDNVRMHLVSIGPEQIQYMNHSFEGVTTTTGEIRKLSKSWFYKKMPNGENVLRKWMCYSPNKKSLYCFCCRLFPVTNSTENAFVSKNGFNVWGKLSPRVAEHESSSAHQQSLIRWKQLELRNSTATTIDALNQDVIQNEQEKWREILKRILDVIRFLAKQNLALRGHQEIIQHDSNQNNGNFIELVQLIAKYDPLLREHVLRFELGVQRISYMSPKIQNEFITLLGDHVKSRIINQIQAAKYYTILLDSTPDVSHIDQTALVLRYVVMDGEQARVEESFLEFLDIKKKDAAEIAATVISKLQSLGLDIMDCRGQGYDNAAVMKGQHSGVQKRIRDVNPKAQYIACSNHSLNLAGVHAGAAEINSITFFGTLDQLHNFFSVSTHRWDILTKTVGVTLKRSVETRWSARGEAVKMVKNQFVKLIECLEVLSEPHENVDTKSGAGCLLVALQSFTFLTFLGFWSNVLTEVNDTQTYLQKKGLCVRECATKLKALCEFLRIQRDNLTDESIHYAELICEELGIPAEPQLRTRRKKKMPGEQASDTGLSRKDELRRELYATNDRIRNEMLTRFEQLHEIDKKFAFMSNAELLNNESLMDISAAPDDINKIELKEERTRLQTFVAAFPGANELKQQGSLELLCYIQKHKLCDSLPNIVILLRVYLTMAVSIATCERSFSKLKLIKNYLRSRISNVRLNNLAILSIEHELCNSISFSDVINNFASKKARKINL